MHFLGKDQTFLFSKAYLIQVSKQLLPKFGRISEWDKFWNWSFSLSIASCDWFRLVHFQYDLFDGNNPGFACWMIFPMPFLFQFSWIIKFIFFAVCWLCLFLDVNYSSLCLVCVFLCFFREIEKLCTPYCYFFSFITFCSEFD